MNADFKLGDLVHSPLYRFGTVIKEYSDNVIIEWEQSTVISAKGHTSIYKKNGHSSISPFPMIHIVNEREDFTPKDEKKGIAGGQLRDWIITSMDLYYKIKK